MKMLKNAGAMKYVAGKTLWATVAVFAMTLATGQAFAQVYALDFVVDEDESMVQIDGEFQGIQLEGDKTTAVGGTLEVRTLLRGSKPLGFIIDASSLNQLDPINVEVPNPIWFLPPLAEMSITDLSLGVTTAGIPFKNGLQFSTNSGRIEVLSGMAEGKLLGDPIGPLDLSGNIQENVLIEGGMQLVDNGTRVKIAFPIHQDIEIPDVPGTYQIDGIVVAYATL